LFSLRILAQLCLINNLSHNKTLSKSCAGFSYWNLVKITAKSLPMYSVLMDSTVEFTML
jgi:hypothetical protein